MRALVVACVVACGVACAKAELGPDSGPLDASPSPADAAADSRSDAPLQDGGGDAGPLADADADAAAVDGGCWIDSGMGGIGTPSGTTATATTTYQTNVPGLAVDMNLGTYWNASTTSGSLTITFPSPRVVSGVQIASIALPASTETYTVFGISNSVASQLGTDTFNVAQGTTINPVIAVPPGTFEAIRIDVSSNASWVAVAEVSIITPLCP